jgi:hypothetical protein
MKEAVLGNLYGDKRGGRAPVGRRGGSGGNVKWRWWGGEVPWKGRGGGSDECGVARSGGAGLDVNGGAGRGIRGWEDADDVSG